MAQITVRNLDERIIARLEQRAAKHGRSLQAEVKAILAEAASVNSGDEACITAMEWQQRLAGRIAGDSADLLREDRER